MSDIEVRRVHHSLMFSSRKESRERKKSIDI